MALLNPATALSQERKSSYPAVLLDTIWEVDYEHAEKFPILIKFFDNGYLVEAHVNMGASGTNPSVSPTIGMEYKVKNNLLEFSRPTFGFKGKIGKNHTLEGQGRDGNSRFTRLRAARNQELLDYCNSKNLFSFSPLSIFPLHKNKLSGKLNSTIEVVNTFDFFVAVAVVGDNAASYFVAPPDGRVGFRLVPNGRYQIYYVYYNEPDAVYQGDDITVNNQTVSIRLEQITGGNYNIRKSK